MPGDESERFVAMVQCQLMKATIHVRDPSSYTPLHLLALRAVAKSTGISALSLRRLASGAA